MEQAVILTIDLGDRLFALRASGWFSSFCCRLEELVNADGSGELDGDEFSTNVYTVYLYGIDAKKLFRSIEPHLRAEPLCIGAMVSLRYGIVDDPDALEEKIKL